MTFFALQNQTSQNDINMSLQNSSCSCALSVACRGDCSTVWKPIFNLWHDATGTHIQDAEHFHLI